MERLLKNITVQTIDEYLDLGICDTKEECFDEIFDQLQFKNTIPLDIKNKVKRMIINIS